MCLYNGFKDTQGDRAAGVRTLQVAAGRPFALWTAGIASGLLLFLSGPIFCGTYSGFATWCLCVYLAIRLHRLVVKKEDHRSTLANVQYCAVFQLLPISAFGLEAVLLTVLGTMLIFRWYPDEKE